MLNLTDYLAFFGAICGGTAMILNFKNYYDSRPNCKVIPFENQDDGFIFSVDQNADKYKQNIRCTFFVQIENHSSKPITITRFYLSIPKLYKQNILSDSLIIANHPYVLERKVNNETKEYHIDIARRQLIPPFTIDGYGARQGSIFFVFDLDHIPERIEAKLTIHTTRNKVFKSITLNKL